MAEESDFKITTVNLTDEQFKYLKKAREDTGTPMGFHIRKALDQYITKEKRKAQKKS